ncbi:STAS-like domain-containing protein [Methylomonas rapida]|uniref:STAS-like domain-containing protein n=1 Tax=Methylomonas rapida TaxID=2963939 RepID=A0ABY7GN72_9GAMM|nr:STAS-like domain-containing protein [Methylomonas rapida]WAR45955.1 STAS-like domain-containing protein [Methylomonas rapida]
MHIVVVTATSSQIPQPIHGKNLARLARECFANQQSLTIDFKDVKSITLGFFQELFLPLIAEFGSDFLKSKLKIVNMAGYIDNMMQSAFKNLEVYFDKLTAIDELGCDEEIYAMNQAWLIKAREIARENPVLTELVLGITDETMRLAVERLSLEDIDFIARSNWLCFTPRFSSQFIQNINRESPPMVEAMLGLSGTID